MKNKTETIRKIITSLRKSNSLNDLYSNSSMIERKPTEIGVSCKEVSFIVEWQMQHKLPKEIPEFNFVTE